MIGRLSELRVTTTTVCAGLRYSRLKSAGPCSSISSSIRPPPRATQVSGSSAIDDRQAGLFHQQLVDVAQQRAAAGQHDAALGDVGAELGRSLLERLP